VIEERIQTQLPSWQLSWRGGGKEEQVVQRKALGDLVFIGGDATWYLHLIYFEKCRRTSTPVCTETAGAQVQV